MMPACSPWPAPVCILNRDGDAHPLTMYNLLSPWPPQANGIADYAMEIARHSAHPVRIVTRALRPRFGGEHTALVSDADAARSGVLAHAPNVYHFGNNPDHVFLIPLFLRHPGIAVVHDVSLHYLVEKATSSLPGFFATQLAAETPALAGALRALWQVPGMKRALDYQEFKLLSWLRAATGIVVHSHFAARAIAPHLPGRPVHVIPHFAYRATSAGATAPLKAAARASLRITQDQFVISTVGFVTRNKQYDAVLRAIGQLPPAMRSRIVFLVAGEVRKHEYDLETLIDTSGCRDVVRTTGYLAEAEMQKVLQASDLVMSLRYPTFGESSGSVARALGMGCALVVTEGGSYAELPDDTCIKIPPKQDPSNELAELIRGAVEDPRRLADIRAAALDYARSALDPHRIAQRYSEIAHAA